MDAYHEALLKYAEADVDFVYEKICEQELCALTAEASVADYAPEPEEEDYHREGICYVNFDEGFLNMDYKISPEVRIYSVVNSIVEGGEMGQVQILINGKTDAVYQDNITLEKPFSRNLELVEEKEKD